MNADGTVDFQEFLSKLGVDIIGGDLNGLSTRIHDENEAKVQLLKQDQNARCRNQPECLSLSTFLSPIWD